MLCTWPPVVFGGVPLPAVLLESRNRVLLLRLQGRQIVAALALQWLDALDGLLSLVGLSIRSALSGR